MEKEFTYSLDEISKLVETLRPHIDKATIVTFEGQLGAGKTTLIKEIIASYGIEEDVTSPTFNYVNIYEAPDGKTIYHFDLYRLDHVDDFMALGFDGYLEAPDSICLIEWPEDIKSLLPLITLKLQLEHVSNEQRKLIIKK